MTVVRAAVGIQNMTEGRVTQALKDCDIVIGQEIARWRIRLGLRGYAHWFPRRDRHQSISVRKGAFTVTRTGYDRFHGSGKAERLGFRTPARGMIWVVGYFDTAPDQLVMLFGIWFVNSWRKVGGKRDATTPGRQKLVLVRSIPVVAKRVAWAQAQGYAVFGGGDANSKPWDGHIDGLVQVADHGLDRAWVGSNGLIKAGRAASGPKTGVGPDLEHKSVLAPITLHPKTETA